MKRTSLFYFQFVALLLSVVFFLIHTRWSFLVGIIQVVLGMVALILVAAGRFIDYNKSPEKKFFAPIHMGLKGLDARGK